MVPSRSNEPDPSNVIVSPASAAVRTVRVGDRWGVGDRCDVGGGRGGVGEAAVVGDGQCHGERPGGDVGVVGGGAGAGVAVAEVPVVVGVDGAVEVE